MSIASPISQLVGLLASALICGMQILACFLFFRRGLLGPWVMLAGAIATSLAVLAPGAGYLLIEYFGTGDLASSIEPIMYFTLWSWVGLGGGLCFSSGLLLTALGRRALDRRVRELEAILGQAVPGSVPVSGREIR